MTFNSNSDKIHLWESCLLVTGQLDK